MTSTIDKNKYSELEEQYCGSTARTCFNNPNICGDLFIEFVKNTTDISMPPTGQVSVYHEICDEAKKGSTSRITDQNIRNAVLSSCNNKYAINTCNSKNLRFSNGFSNREPFAGSCIDICSSNIIDDSTKISCLEGTIQYCKENNFNTVHTDPSNCNFPDYFNTDLYPKNINDPVLSSLFKKTYNADINNFKTQFCNSSKAVASYCPDDNTIITTISSTPSSDSSGSSSASTGSTSDSTGSSSASTGSTSDSSGSTSASTESTSASTGSTSASTGSTSASTGSPSMLKSDQSIATVNSSNIKNIDSQLLSTSKSNTSTIIIIIVIILLLFSVIIGFIIVRRNTVSNDRDHIIPSIPNEEL